MLIRNASVGQEVSLCPSRPQSFHGATTTKVLSTRKERRSDLYRRQ